MDASPQVGSSKSAFHIRDPRLLDILSDPRAPYPSSYGSQSVSTATTSLSNDTSKGKKKDNLKKSSTAPNSMTSNLKNSLLNTPPLSISGQAKAICVFLLINCMTFEGEKGSLGKFLVSIQRGQTKQHISTIGITIHAIELSSQASRHVTFWIAFSTLSSQMIQGIKPRSLTRVGAYVRANIGIVVNMSEISFEAPATIGMAMLCGVRAFVGVVGPNSVRLNLTNSVSITGNFARGIGRRAFLVSGYGRWQ
ncbi:hypothetical protein BJ165DRAFT_1400647 [Panaeolus papilionaceus]|nr:hypothetical protein BJ165DRAFT_1400647 [Panaeolus papilionaceus]